MKGYNLTEQQCRQCQMPLMEYHSVVVCVVCPVLKKKQQQRQAFRVHRYQQAKPPRSRGSSKRSHSNHLRAVDGESPSPAIDHQASLPEPSVQASGSANSTEAVTAMSFDESTRPAVPAMIDTPQELMPLPQNDEDGHSAAAGTQYSGSTLTTLLEAKKAKSQSSGNPKIVKADSAPACFPPSPEGPRQASNLFSARKERASYSDDKSSPVGEDAKPKVADDKVILQGAQVVVAPISPSPSEVQDTERLQQSSPKTVLPGTRLIVASSNPTAANFADALDPFVSLGESTSDVATTASEGVEIAPGLKVYEPHNSARADASTSSKNASVSKKSGSSASSPSVARSVHSSAKLELSTSSRPASSEVNDHESNATKVKPETVLLTDVPLTAEALSATIQVATDRASGGPHQESETSAEDMNPFSKDDLGDEEAGTNPTGLPTKPCNNQTSDETSVLTQPKDTDAATVSSDRLEEKSKKAADKPLNVNASPNQSSGGQYASPELQALSDRQTGKTSAESSTEASDEISTTFKSMTETAPLTENNIQVEVKVARMTSKRALELLDTHVDTSARAISQKLLTDRAVGPTAGSAGSAPPILETPKGRTVEIMTQTSPARSPTFESGGTANSAPASIGQEDMDEPRTADSSRNNRREITTQTSPQKQNHRWQSPVKRHRDAPEFPRFFPTSTKDPNESMGTPSRMVIGVSHIDSPASYQSSITESIQTSQSRFHKSMYDQQTLSPPVKMSWRIKPPRGTKPDAPSSNNTINYPETHHLPVVREGETIADQMSANNLMRQSTTCTTQNSTRSRTPPGRTKYLLDETETHVEVKLSSRDSFKKQLADKDRAVEEAKQLLVALTTKVQRELLQKETELRQKECELQMEIEAAKSARQEAERQRELMKRERELQRQIEAAKKAREEAERAREDAIREAQRLVQEREEQRQSQELDEQPKKERKSERNTTSYQSDAGTKEDDNKQIGGVGDAKKEAEELYKQPPADTPKTKERVVEAREEERPGEDPDAKATEWSDMVPEAIESTTRGEERRTQDRSVGLDEASKLEAVVAINKAPTDESSGAGPRVLRQTIQYGSAFAIAEAEGICRASAEDYRELVPIEKDTDHKPRWESLRKEGPSLMARRVMAGWRLLHETCKGKECERTRLLRDNSVKQCVVCGGSGNGSDGVYALLVAKADDEADATVGVESSCLSSVKPPKEISTKPHRSAGQKGKNFAKLTKEVEKKRDLVSKEIGKRMLKGWTLLDASCPKCVMPLMTDLDRVNEVCVLCGIVGAISDKTTASLSSWSTRLTAETRTSKQSRSSKSPFSQALSSSKNAQGKFSLALSHTRQVKASTSKHHVLSEKSEAHTTIRKTDMLASPTQTIGSGTEARTLSEKREARDPSIERSLSPERQRSRSLESNRSKSLSTSRAPSSERSPTASLERTRSTSLETLERTRSASLDRSKSTIRSKATGNGGAHHDTHQPRERMNDEESTSKQMPRDPSLERPVKALRASAGFERREVQSKENKTDKERRSKREISPKHLVLSPVNRLRGGACDPPAQQGSFFGRKKGIDVEGSLGGVVVWQRDKSSDKSSKPSELEREVKESTALDLSTTKSDKVSAPFGDGEKQRLPPTPDGNLWHKASSNLSNDKKPVNPVKETSIEEEEAHDNKKKAAVPPPNVSVTNNLRENAAEEKSSYEDSAEQKEIENFALGNAGTAASTRISSAKNADRDKKQSPEPPLLGLGTTTIEQNQSNSKDVIKLEIPRDFNVEDEFHIHELLKAAKNRRPKLGIDTAFVKRHHPMTHPSPGMTEASCPKVAGSPSSLRYSRKAKTSPGEKGLSTVLSASPGARRHSALRPSPGDRGLSASRPSPGEQGLPSLDDPPTPSFSILSTPLGDAITSVSSAEESAVELSRTRHLSDSRRRMPDPEPSVIATSSLDFASSIRPDPSISSSQRSRSSFRQRTHPEISVITKSTDDHTSGADARCMSAPRPRMPDAKTHDACILPNHSSGSSVHSRSASRPRITPETSTRSRSDHTRQASCGSRMQGRPPVKAVPELASSKTICSDLSSPVTRARAYDQKTQCLEPLTNDMLEVFSKPSLSQSQATSPNRSPEISPEPLPTLGRDPSGNNAFQTETDMVAPAKFHFRNTQTLESKAPANFSIDLTSVPSYESHVDASDLLSPDTRSNIMYKKNKHFDLVSDAASVDGAFSAGNRSEMSPKSGDALLCYSHAFAGDLISPQAETVHTDAGVKETDIIDVSDIFDGTEDFADAKFQSDAYQTSTKCSDEKMKAEEYSKTFTSVTSPNTYSDPSRGSSGTDSSDSKSLHQSKTFSIDDSSPMSRSGALSHSTSSRGTINRTQSWGYGSAFQKGATLATSNSTNRSYASQESPGLNSRYHFHSQDRKDMILVQGRFDNSNSEDIVVVEAREPESGASLSATTRPRQPLRQTPPPFPRNRIQRLPGTPDSQLQASISNFSQGRYTHQPILPTTSSAYGNPTESAMGCDVILVEGERVDKEILVGEPVEERIQKDIILVEGGPFDSDNHDVEGSKLIIRSGESVGSATLDAIMSRIEETKAQLAETPNSSDGFIKQQKLRELIDNLALAADEIETQDRLEREREKLSLW